jgi:hypothetical protein
MGQRNRFRSTWKGILLIATAIQALTPDLHDLASSRCIDMIAHMLDDHCMDRDEEDSGEDVAGVLELTEHRRTLARLRHRPPARPTSVAAIAGSLVFPASPSDGALGFVGSCARVTYGPCLGVLPKVRTPRSIAARSGVGDVGGCAPVQDHPPRS